MAFAERVPVRFRPAVEALERLAGQERYRAAMVFGSGARGELGEASDLDAQVVVTEDTGCTAINHPVLGGVKLDLTFKSMAQLRASSDEEVRRRERVPMLAESAIVFDKDGDLTRLRDELRAVEPRPAPSTEYLHQQFMLHHADDKASRHHEDDPSTALLVMQTGLMDVLNMHYRLRGRWKVSNKRMLADLRDWDPPLARLVESFVGEGALGAKYQIWSSIVDHVAATMGGRQPIAETSCGCPICRRDLAAVLS